MLLPSQGPVQIIYRVTSPFPLRFASYLGVWGIFDLVEREGGGAELRFWNGSGVPAAGLVFRTWQTMEIGLWHCRHGLVSDYTPEPNLWRDLARAGLAVVVVGPHCPIRYTDPTAKDRGWWPVPPCPFSSLLYPPQGP